jgi:hypothetical protein
VRNARPENPPPQQHQQRRQQGDHGEQAAENADGAGRAEHEVEADVCCGQAQQTEADGDTGRGDRWSCPPQRLGHRRAPVGRQRQFLPIPGKQQQRIVRTDPEDQNSDHRRVSGVDGQTGATHQRIEHRLGHRIGASDAQQRQQPQQ